MSQQTQPDTPEENPTDEQIDVEGPNESAPGHNPEDAGEQAPEEATETGE